ncbi:MAG: transposase [Pyrinomonadaceae bacterium]
MSNNGTGRLKRKYDEEFKRSALKMIDNGQTVRLVAESLGVGENLLHKWKSARCTNASGLEKENIELRARNKQLEMERDILKKALSIFSREK